MKNRQANRPRCPAGKSPAPARLIAIDGPGGGSSFDEELVDDTHLDLDEELVDDDGGPMAAGVFELGARNRETS